MPLLIVAEDRSLCAHLVALCEDNGDTADAVGSVAEALQALAARCYGLAIIDLRLPDGDGVTVLRRLRSLGNMMPVAVRAGVAEGGLRAVMFDDGADIVVERLSSAAGLLGRLRKLRRSPEAAGMEGWRRAEAECRASGNPARCASPESRLGV